MASRHWFRPFLIYIFVAVFSVFIGQLMIYATATNWTFDTGTVADYTLSDSNLVEFADLSGTTVARLKALPTFVDTTLTEFNAGDYTTNSGITNPPGPNVQTRVVSNSLQIKPYTATAFTPLTDKPMTGLEKALVALYHMDNDTSDSTAQQENGTATNLNMAQASKSGYGQAAGGYDGTAGVTGPRFVIADDSDFDFSPAEFTLSAWVYFNQTNNANRYIVAKWQSQSLANCATADAQREWSLRLNANEALVLDISNNGSATAGTATSANAVVPISPSSAWTHVAVSKAQGATNDTTMYINGKKVTMADASSATTLNTASSSIVTIGTSPNNTTTGGDCTTNTWFGDIDEVAIFNRALSAEEIIDIYGNHQRNVGLWLFESSNGNDTSGFTNHASTTNGSPSYGAAKIGNGVTFDGSASISTANANPHFNPTNDLTLEAWINPTALPGSGAEAYLISSHGPANLFSLRLDNNGTNTTLEAGWGANTLRGNKAIATSTWTHVAAIWAYDSATSRGSVRLYVNGVEDAQTRLTAVPLNLGDAGMRFGQDGAVTPANGFNGSMDEIMMFLKARPQEDLLIDAGGYPRTAQYRSSTKDAGLSRAWDNMEWTQSINYGNGISSSATSLVHLYRFNEDSAAGNITDHKGGSTYRLNIAGTNAVESILFDPDTPASTTPRARYFDRASGDYLFSNGSIPAYTSYTIEAWVHFGVADASASDYILSINDDPSIWRDSSEVLHAKSNAVTLNSSKIIRDTRWHHIVFSNNAGTLTLYLDGVQVATNTGGGASSNSTLFAGDDGTSTGLFDGAVEEVAIYNSGTVLDGTAILNHYKQMIMGVKHLSRSCDDSACSGESLVGFDNVANQVTPSNNAGMRGWWKFDENSYNGTIDEVADSQSNGIGSNHGVAIGVMTNQDAQLGRSAVFNGTTDYIAVKDDSDLQIPQPLSIVGWIKMDEEATEGAAADGATIITKQCFLSTTCNGATSSFALEISNTQQLRLRIGHSGGEVTFLSNDIGDVPVGQWAHVAATYDTGGQARFYVNGTARGVPTANDQVIAYDFGPLVIGKDPSGTRSGFRGKIDNLAVYNTLLDGTAIANLFAEANPYKYVSRATNQDPGPADQRYFQYKTMLTTDGSDTPSVDDITIKNTVYDPSNPYIETTSANAKVYTTFGSYAITYGPNTPYGGAVKMIFKNGALGNWYWWNAGAVPANKWELSNSGTGSYASSTPVAQLTQTAMEFLDDTLGADGTLYWRMYFNSPTGAEQIEVDNIQIDDITASLTTTAPASQTLVVGDPLNITWDFNTVSTVVLDWTTGSYTTFNPPGATGTPAETNGGTGCTDPGVGSGCYQVTVPDAIGSNFQVRVSDKDAVATPSVGATNTVRGKVTVTSPASLVADTDYTIQWVAYGSTGVMNGNNTQIDYDPDTSGGFSGGDIVNISTTAINGDNGACSAGAATSYSYPGCWIYHVPATISNGSIARFRICDPAACADNNYVVTTSAFSVTGQINASVTPSLSGTAWKVETGTDMAGNTVDLQWTYKGSVGNLRLYFDKTGAFGGAERTIRGAGNELSASGANGTLCTPPSSTGFTGSGCYRLSGAELPNADELTHGSTAAKFRLSAAGLNPVVNGDTTGFEVRGWYDLTTPGSTVTWRYGENQSIVWNTHGNGIGGTGGSAGTGKILLQYNNNSGSGSWTNLGGFPGTGLADSDGDSRSWAWNPVTYIGCYNPERGCDKVRIRIIDYDTGATYSDVQGSGAGFDMEVLPSLTLTNPEGVALQINSNYSAPGVSWTIGGLLGGNVNVYYSTNNFGAEGSSGEPDGTSNCTVATGEGSQCPVVTGVLSSASGQAWTIPNTPSTNAKLRIVSALDTDISDDVNTADRIHAKFSVPVPATEVEAGTASQNITWSHTSGAGNSTTVPNVKIQYSTNNFTSATTIHSSTTNDGSFGWAVPTTGLVHDKVKIRVSDANDSIVPPDSASDSNEFKVKAKMRIIEPDGSAPLKIGVQQDIKWGFYGTLSEVDLKLCKNPPTCSTLADISLNLAANAATGGCSIPTGLGTGETGGCYRWTDGTTGGVGDHRGIANQIKIYDSDASTACDPSANCGTRPAAEYISTGPDFKILQNIVVTAPNTAVKWDNATANTVQFTVQGTGQSTFDLKYSSDGGSDGYPGTIVNDKVLAPVPDGTQRSYSHSWTTPASVSTSAIKYRVKVKDDDSTDYNEAEDISNVNFDLVARFDISAPAGPNGTTTWRIGDSPTIVWTSAGTVTKVNVQYFTGAIGSWQDIALNDDNDGSTSFPIPNTAGIIASDAVIRIVDNDSGHVLRTTASQSAQFNIVPAFTWVTPDPAATPSPLTGVIWRQGQTRNLQWRVNGLATNATVTLEYSTDGSAWTVIDNTTAVAGQNGGCTLPSDGTGTEGCWNWTNIPAGAVSNTTYLRISDRDGTHPNSTANNNGRSAVFEVKQTETIDLAAPKSQTYLVNANVDVKWDATGPFVTAGGVRVQYKFGGGAWTTFSGGDNVDPDAETGGCTKAPNTGCVRLAVPDAVSTDFRVRVLDRDDADINDANPDNASEDHTVNGQISSVTPTASSILTIGDVITITWTALGSTGSMSGNNTKIEYDPDNSGGFGGGDVVTLTTSAANGNNTSGDGSCTATTANPPIYYGCYKYALPDPISAVDVRQFRVTDPQTGSPSFTALSGAFSVTGTVVPSLNPALSGSKAWKVEDIVDFEGNTIKLEWTYSGSNIGNLNLQFDKTGNFSGGERTIKSGLNPETVNGTACTDPGTNAGCYIISNVEVNDEMPRASELTHGAKNAKFRLVAPTHSALNLRGDTAAFEVRGWYKITGPSSTGTYLVGDPLSITWETHGTLIGGTTGNVFVQYNTASGTGGWTTLSGTTPNIPAGGLADADGNSNSLSWPVEDIFCTNPKQGCTTVRLRIIDKDTLAYSDQPGNTGSEFDIAVLPKLSALTPSGANLQIGNSQAVSWTKTGSLEGTVDVYYSTNDDFASACNSGTGAGKCTVCLDVNSASSTTCASNWSIPDIVFSNNVKLKVVSDLNTNIAFTQSAASVIHSKFSVSDPGGTAGQIYVSEETSPQVTISWSDLTSSANVSAVKILYSINDFASSTTIIGSTGNDTAHPWTIPEALVHNAIKVRVQDANDTTSTPTVSAGTSANAFGSRSDIRIIQPSASGIALKVGDTYEIKWGYKGSMSTVDLELCADYATCGTVVPIASNQTSGQGAGCTAPTGGELGTNENGGCYLWTVTNNRGLTNRIRVVDSDSDTVPPGGTRIAEDDYSNNNFQIMSNIAVTTPSASGIKWDADTDQTVQFQVKGTGMTAVDILFSDDSGTNYTFIENWTLSPAPNGSTFENYSRTWHTPSLISNTTDNPQTRYLIKVQDPDTTNYAQAVDVSDNMFDVVAKFTWTAPVGTDNWQVGENKTLSWSTKGIAGTVKLQWRTNNTSYATIIQTGSEGGAPAPTATDGSGNVSNNGTFVWQIPSSAGVVDTAARIRIQDAVTGAVIRDSLDVSSNFEIIPKFTMYYPVGGESITAGSTQNIQWYTKGPVNNIKLQYKVGAGSWTDFENPAGGSITSIPNGNNSCTLPPVSGSDTRACYNWKVHPNTIGTSNVKFRVVDVDAGHPDSTQITANGESPVSFTVTKGFVLTQPSVADIQMTVGGTYDIKWEAYGSFSAGTVDLVYSGDDFTSDIKEIPTDNTPTNASNSDNGTGCTTPSPTQGGVGGCYRWTPIPNDIRANLKLRVRENVSPNTVDISDNTFEIVGPLSMVYPNGSASQYFTVGQTITIQWGNNLLLTRETPVDLEYSTNNFGSQNGAHASEPDGDANCTLATGEGACQVKNALETPTVAEDLDNNDGSAHYNGTSGYWEYDWVIPDNIASAVKVRVIKADTPTVGDESNSTFKIIGGVSLSVLGGGDQVWKMGDPNTISWTRNGTAQSGGLFDNFRIDYSTDNTFATGVITIDSDVTLAEAGCSGDNTCNFDWTPDAATHTTNITATPVYYIRVMDPEMNDAKSISTAKFELAGKTALQLLQGGDETYKIGTAVVINWNKSGNQKATYFDNFKIEYSTSSTFASGNTTVDADVTFAEAGCSSDDTCTYSWTPDAATYSTAMTTSPTYYLRVYDPDNTDTQSTSGSNRFELRGDIAIGILNGADAIYKIGQTPGISIDWTKKGNEKVNVFDSFDIQMSTDINFSSSTTIATLTFAAAGCDADDSCTYSWTPSAATYSALISSDAVYYMRVLEVQNPDTASRATNRFELRGDLTLDAMPGNRNYQIGNGPTLTWSKKGNSQTTHFDNFKLQMSTDSAFPATSATTDIVTLNFAAAGCDADDTCQYAWSIDNATFGSKISGSQVYYLRVLDPDNTDTASSSFDFVSGKQFKVMGRITLDPLPGTQLYKINTPVTFTWTREGNSTATYFDDFTLQYSTDSSFASGVNTIGTYTFTQAQCDADNSCQRSWTPGDSDPIVPNKDYYLRVVDLGDTDTASSSASFGSNKQFELAGDLDLTVLDSADETYVVGTYAGGNGKRITFNKYGAANGSTFDNVNIEYSTDSNFVSPAGTSIASPVINGSGTICTGNSCTLDWDIPTNATLTGSAVYYMRVIDPNNADSVNLSAFKFKLRGGFSNLNPTGATEWQIGTDQTFSWTTNGAISNVKIAYSTDNFSNQTFMQVSGGKLVTTAVTDFGTAANVTNTPNGGSSYTLTVPNAASLTNFKLRVYDANDSAIYLDTVGFKVHAKFTISTPGGTFQEIKKASTAYALTWTVAGTVTKAKFEYSTDGAVWNPITSTQSGSLTDANGISTDSTLINTTRTFNWTIPAVKSNNAYQAYVRVSVGNTDNTPDTDTSGVSPNAFKIVAKITVLSPNAENTPLWKVGETDKVITWSTSPSNLGGTNQVKLYYFDGADWNQIGAATGNDGTEPWNPIPDAVTNAAMIRVEDSADADGTDQSDAAFSIAGNLTLSTPLGNDEIFVYAPTPAALAVTTPIQWTSAGSAMTNVLLQYSNDNFASDIRPIATITNNAVGANSYPWQVPDTIGSQWRVRVLNNTSGTPAVESKSTSNFKILARYAFTSHNTNADKCLLGQSCTITWAKAGSSTDITLEYSLNGTAGPWTVLHTGFASVLDGGSYNWSVPATGVAPGTSVRYRATDAQTGHPVPSAGALEVTDANSKVVAAFPAANIKVAGSTVGGQTWAVGQALTFDYTYTGIVSTILVEYSLDNFATAPIDITASISSDNTNGDGTGSFSYLFTDLLASGANTTNIKFRILDAGVPDTTGNTTNGVTSGFKLRGVLAITNPNVGTERWVVGESATVAWTATGSIDDVKIEYDDNATFLSPATIIASTTSTPNVGGSYNFTVNTTNLPDLDTAPLYYKTIYVRISDNEGTGGSPIHGTSNDASNLAHKIVGKLSLIEASSVPQAGAKWPVGSPQTITWATSGKVPAVDLYYVADGTFNGDQVLITSGTCASPVTNTQGTNVTSANTSCSWTPPVSLPLTATYQIRVVDRGDNTTPELASFILSTDTAAGSTSGALTGGVDRDSGAFKIHGFADNVVLTSPTGILKHKASDSATITWDTTGDSLNSVDIQYRDASGGYLAGAWQTIELAHDNSTGGGQRGTKSWTIPETFNSTNTEVRVKPADGTTDGFDSTVALKFMPKITVNAPISGDTLLIAQNTDITWAIYGVIPSIGIRYRDDGAATTNDYPAGSPYEIFTSGSPLVINGTTVTKTGTNAKYQWNVADTPSTQGRLMIYDPTDPTDVYGVSANNTANFNIRGFFTLTTPTTGSELEVYHATANPNTFAINWNWGGTIPDVIIEYSDSYDGSNPASFDAGALCLNGQTPASQVGGVCATVPNGAGSSGSFSYAWQVPNDISRGTKPYFLRIKSATDSGTYDILPDGAGNGFKIKSKFTVTSPNGTENWFVGTPTYNITWTNSGTVPTVVLEYSGANWLHEDANNDNVLNSGEDTNGNGLLDRILCINGGTYPNCTAIPNDGVLDGAGSEDITQGPWKIADDGKLVPWNCNSLSDPDPNDTAHPCKIDTAKLRVRDGGDTAVMDDSNNYFTARYMAKRWYLQNAVTGANLDSITMYENSIHKQRANSGQNTPGIVSPYTIWSPSGINYTIAFSKVGFTDYFDAAQTSTLTDVVQPSDPGWGNLLAKFPELATDHPMLDEVQQIFLSDIVAHNDQINTTFSYTQSSDSITFKIWYSRDGLNVVTTTQAELLVYNSSGTLVINQTSAVQNPANSGVYTFTLTPSGLVKGQNYDARNKVRLPTGTDLQGYTIVNIGQQSESQTTDANVATITPIITTNIDAKLSTEFADVKQKIDDVNTAVTDTLNQKIGTDPDGKSLMQKMDEQTETITDAITDFQGKADDAIYRMQDEITKGAIRLIMPDTTKVGTTETIRVGTEEAVTPTVDLICPNGTPIMQGVALAPDAGQIGIYAVDIKFDAFTFKCAVAKAVTVIASATIPSKDNDANPDPAFTATAIGSIFVTSTDLDTIQGLAAAGLNAEKAAKDAKESVEKVARALQGDGNVLEALSGLQQSVNRLPSLVNKDSGDIKGMQATLDEIAQKLNGFMGGEGVDLKAVLKEEIGEGMKGVRNKVDRTLAATQVMKNIVERKIGKSDEPVIQSFYEIGSVKLRVVAVNPSSEKSQKVPIKIYLPKEVIPDDIIDMGDLKVGYDSSKSLYYAYNDAVELAPQETRVFEVRLEDVWKIPNEEMDKIKEQTERALKHLETTPYIDHAKAIVETINRRLTDIRTRQEDESVSREEHIGAYRVNLGTLEDVKADIALLEKMLQHTGAPPSIEFLKDTIFEQKKDLDKVTAWKLILGIIGFLGLLGLGFYLRWFMLIKMRRSSVEAVANAAPSIGEHVDEIIDMKSQQVKSEEKKDDEKRKAG